VFDLRKKFGERERRKGEERTCQSIFRRPQALGFWPPAGAAVAVSVRRWFWRRREAPIPSGIAITGGRRSGPPSHRTVENSVGPGLTTVDAGKTIAKTARDSAEPTLLQRCGDCRVPDSSDSVVQTGAIAPGGGSRDGRVALAVSKYHRWLGLIRRAGAGVAVQAMNADRAFGGGKFSRVKPGRGIRRERGQFEGAVEDPDRTGLGLGDDGFTIEVAGFRREYNFIHEGKNSNPRGAGRFFNWETRVQQRGRGHQLEQVVTKGLRRTS